MLCVATPSALANVSTPTVKLTTTAAGAAGVDYRVFFNVTSGLGASNASLTITAPAGTSFANTTAVVIDVPANTRLAQCCVTLSNANTTMRIPVGAAPAGEKLEVWLKNVSNPATAATGLHLTVSTSADPVAVSSALYSIVAAHGVSAPAVKLTTAAAGATGADYRLTFTASSTGALNGNGGFVTVAAPTGTSFAAASVVVTDTLTGQNVATCCIALSNANATIKIPVAGPAAADQLTVWLKNVTNPSAAAAGLHMTVSTSADAVTVSSAPYSIVAAHGVSAPAVKLTTAAAGATGVDYRLTFTTSSTGALNGNGGFVTVAAPTGTSFAAASVVVTDTLTGQNVATCCIALSNANATIKIPVAGSTAGDQLTVWLKNVTNPSAAAAGLHMTVSTSADAVTATSAPYSIVAAHGVSASKVKLTTAAAGATGVDYRLTFTTSSTGSLSGTGGWVTVAAPTGTSFAATSVVITDTLSGQNVASCCVTLSNGNATIKIPVAGSTAGDQLTVWLKNVTNPPAAAAGLHMTVSTSADPVTASSALYSIVAAHGVSAPAVKLSSTAPNATAVKYTVTFNASSTGGLNGTGGFITIAAPAGTSFAGSTSTVTVIDQSADDVNVASCCAILSNSNATIKIPVAGSAALDTLQVIVQNVTNPAGAAGSRRLTVTTTADPVASLSGLY